MQSIMRIQSVNYHRDVYCQLSRGCEYILPHKVFTRYYSRDPINEFFYVELLVTVNYIANDGLPPTAWLVYVPKFVWGYCDVRPAWIAVARPFQSDDSLYAPCTTLMNAHRTAHEWIYTNYKRDEF